MKTPTALLLLCLIAAVASGQDESSPLRPVGSVAAGRSLVIVEIRLRVRDDISRSPGNAPQSYSAEAQYREQMRKLATPLEIPGVVVRPGEVLFAEPSLEPEDYGEVRVRGWDGRRYEAELSGVLNAAAGMFATFQPAEGGPVPVTFGETDRLEFLSLRAIWLEPLLDRIVLRASTGTLDGLDGEGGIFTENPFPFGALLIDAGGRPVGVSLGAYLQARPAGVAVRSSFLGADLLGDPMTSRAALEEAHALVRDRVSQSLVRVKIEYRLPGKDEDSGFRAAGGNQELRDDEAFGILYGPGRVFLPIDPGFAKIRQLARVIAYRGEEEYEGAFIGSFRDYHGLLLEFPGLPEPAEKSAKITKSGAPERFSRFFVAVPERKFGADHIRLIPARLMGEAVVEERGEEKRRPKLSIEPPPGSYLVDEQGRVFGLVSGEKDVSLEGDPDSPFATNVHPRKPPRVFWTRDLLPGWLSPGGHFDLRAEPRTRLMARRLVWLGVEFQYIPKPLAREIEAQDITRDGERGLLVNMVYPGSPAADAGIEPGDVLLSVLEKGKSDAEKKEFLRPAYFEWRNDLNSYGGFRFAPRTNDLTRLLTGLGEGREVVLRWARRGEERSTGLTLVQAPPDFESAGNWKDEKLGMTVKDLTYEVRAFYRLPEVFRGVVVSRVEPGTPAEIAMMEPMAILESINGERIADVDSYRTLVEKALDDGVSAITFLIKRLEGTRFVEVKLTRENGEESGD